MAKTIKWLKEYWVVLLVIAQPLLDVIAFWTASDEGTVSGKIRLAIMMILCVWLIIKERRNKKFLLAVFAAALVFGLHILNGFRVGYRDFTGDLSYAVKVAYMPVMAICLCAVIDDEKKKRAVIWSLMINGLIEASLIVISYVTGTYTTTYGPGLGISGWVIENNRCCHSDILSALCIFLGLLAVESEKPLLNILIPIGITAIFLTNGTQACYLSLFAVMVGYPVYLIVRSKIRKEALTKSQRIVSITMACMFAFSIIIYPFTPRCKMEEIERSFYNDTQEKFEKKMYAMGYDLYEMTPQEKMDNPEVHECLVEYYKPFIYSGVPSMMEKFDIDRIIWKYNTTHDATVIGDNREMKQVYASLLFEDCDLLTRFTGFEFATIGQDLTADLENDWYAIFFYYGYIGFGAYVLLMLYMFYRIYKLLKADYKGSLTDTNFGLLLCFCIQLGLGYFSGATMRRPNASIYLAFVIALIYCSTRLRKQGGEALEA